MACWCLGWVMVESTVPLFREKQAAHKTFERTKIGSVYDEINRDTTFFYGLRFVYETVLFAAHGFR